MKQLLTLPLMLYAMLCMVGCSKEMIVPQASGRPYEVLVVMDDKQWERPAGRALHDALDVDVPGLPQSEASFHISQCQPDDLDRPLRIFRNVIVADIDGDRYTKTKLKFMRDRYSIGQIWVTIQSPSEKEFEEYCVSHKQYIVDFLTKTEMNRLIKELEEKHSEVVMNIVRDSFKCELWAPDEIQSYKRGKQFLWASNNAASGMVNICVYSYPYYGPETFNKAYVVNKRDSVMMRNIPGETPGMYMHTDSLYTDCRPITVHGQYAYEMRGLWYMENAGMGGPYVSQARVDTTRNLVIVAEGFVYAPEKMKRGLIRRVEAALYTLMLPWETSDAAKAEEDAEEEKKNSKEDKE